MQLNQILHALVKRWSLVRAQPVPLAVDSSSVGRAPKKDTGFDILTHSFTKDILMKQKVQLLQSDLNRIVFTEPPYSHQN